MTHEQEMECDKIWKRLRLLFPQFHGNMQFNMNQAREINYYINQGVKKALKA